MVVRQSLISCVLKELELFLVSDLADVLTHYVPTKHHTVNLMQEDLTTYKVFGMTEGLATLSVEYDESLDNRRCPLIYERRMYVADELHGLFEQYHLDSQVDGDGLVVHASHIPERMEAGCRASLVAKW